MNSWSENFAKGNCAMLMEELGIGWLLPPNNSVFAASLWRLLSLKPTSSSISCSSKIEANLK